jgi:hypothetical protein
VQKKEENPEGIRIVTVNYVQKALRSAKDDDRAMYLLNVLDKFSIPFNQAEQYAPLWLAVGRIVFN